MSKTAYAGLKNQGITSIPAMVYYSHGTSDPRVYNGWKSKAAMRKAFDHTHIASE